MTSEAKKEAIRKFKEQKPERGIFAVQCSVTGRTWVGCSRNLGANRNGLWFALRAGGHHEKSLQQEWNAQGDAAFEYRILEVLDEDLPSLNLSDVLKEKAGLWCAQLGARILPG
jgi:hypothetical protein